MNEYFHLPGLLVTEPVSPVNTERDKDSLSKHSTSLTNKQRGNEVTLLPASIDCKSYKLCPDGKVEDHILPDMHPWYSSIYKIL